MSDIITFVPLKGCLFLIIQDKLIKGKLKAKPLALGIERKEKNTREMLSLRNYRLSDSAAEGVGKINKESRYQVG